MLSATVPNTLEFADWVGRLVLVAVAVVYEHVNFYVTFVYEHVHFYVTFVYEHVDFYVTFVYEHVQLFMLL